MDEKEIPFCLIMQWNVDAIVIVGCTWKPGFKVVNLLQHNSKEKSCSWYNNIFVAVGTRIKIFSKLCVRSLIRLVKFFKNSKRNNLHHPSPYSMGNTLSWMDKEISLTDKWVHPRTVGNCGTPLGAAGVGLFIKLNKGGRQLNFYGKQWCH